MAKSSIKLRLKESGGKIQVKALISHPMESGLRKNKKTGEKIPAKYITEVIVESKGKQMFFARLSGSVSKNPFLSVNYAGSKGDTVKVTWKDNTGKSDSLEKKV